jgi:transketolase
MVGWDLDTYVARAEAFGWNALEVDGHDIDAIDAALASAVATAGKPTVLVARTMKGKGVAAVENQNGFHGKPLDDPEAAIAELGGQTDVHVDVARPKTPAPERAAPRALELPRYELGTEVATRKAYGDALAALGTARPDVVVIDGEVSNSTFAETFAKAHPDRYFEMFIAEQQMVAAAVGLQAVGWRPFASTFAAFLSRAYDFVRMAAISRATFSLCGSHAGVSIGEDGPSQMALEDIAALRAIHGSTVLHPCDANQTAKLVAAMAETEGVSYLRTLRPATPVLYAPDEEFVIGGSRVLRASENDEVALIGAGITVHEALKAAEMLAEEGITARVIDLYSIKPIDDATLRAAADATAGRLVTVEDHWAEGGLGDAVLEALADSDVPPRVVKLAVREMPRSGRPEELLAGAGIDADHIAAAARRLATHVSLAR